MFAGSGRWQESHPGTTQGTVGHRHRLTTDLVVDHLVPVHYGNGIGPAPSIPDETEHPVGIAEEMRIAGRDKGRPVDCRNTVAWRATQVDLLRRNQATGQIETIVVTPAGH